MAGSHNEAFATHHVVEGPVRNEFRPDVSRCSLRIIPIDRNPTD